MSGSPERRSIADRVYSLLLRLYPREFRDRFGADMTDFFRDRRRGAARHGGALRAAAAWTRGLADIVAAPRSNV